MSTDLRMRSTLPYGQEDKVNLFNGSEDKVDLLDRPEDEVDLPNGLQKVKYKALRVIKHIGSGTKRSAKTRFIVHAIQRDVLAMHALLGLC